MLILVRGVPGSGKTTFVKTTFPNEFTFSKINGNGKYIHLEADMYFIDDKGNYNWSPQYIKEAHRWCTDTARIMMNNNVNVIVSNTFTTLKEMQPYIDHAKLLGIDVWVYRMMGQFTSVHNVPDDVIVKMKNRFENYEDEIFYGANIHEV